MIFLYAFKWHKSIFKVIFLFKYIQPIINTGQNYLLTIQNLNCHLQILVKQYFFKNSNSIESEEDKTRLLPKAKVFLQYPDFHRNIVESGFNL